MPVGRAETVVTAAIRIVLSLLPGVAAGVAAWPILRNGFYADDYLHLFELASFGPGEFVVSPYGGHMYLVRNAVFYLSYLAFGMEPARYLGLALATHVATSVLVATVARRLTGDALVACLAGVLFAVSPADHGTLGWYSVYGHALATVATLAALLLVVPRPGEDGPLAPRTALAVAALLLVASQCFGTGAAMGLTIPVVVVLLRPATLRDRASLAILAAIPLLVLLAWTAMTGRRSRLNPFGLESTVGMVGLATDWPHVGLVAAHVSAMGVEGLLLGAPFPLDHHGSLLSLGAVATFLGAVAAAFVLGDGRVRRALLACMLGVATCYLAVAAGRGAMYVAVSRDRLVASLATATRYHYLPQALLALVLAVTLAELGRHLPWRRAGVALLASWIAWAVAVTRLLPAPAPLGVAEAASVTRARQHLEQAVRTWPPGATACLPVEPVPLLLGVPGSLGVYLLYYPGDELEGRRVRFVTSEPKLLALREAGGRLRRLLVLVGECPPRTEPQG